MVRLNLQLFAKSINDIAKEVIRGNWGNGNERKTKLTQAGYNYSEVQSVVNSMLKGNTTPTTTTPKTNPPKNTTTTPTNTSPNVKVNGVDQSLTNTMNSSFSQSNDVTNKYQEADKNYSSYKELANTTDIIDQSTWDALNSSFVASDAYNQAMQYTNGLLEKLNSGKTSYTDQIKDLMSQIQNREDFEYDVDKDTLFQQALASAMGSGKSAMQDTIGQASALTGGYGSTYATSAGNQAYNAYIEDAYNNLPEYYNMALQAYQAEGQEMYQQLDMLNTADATEWGRTYDAWQSNFANAQQIYNQDYSLWQDSINNAYNSANLQLSEHNQLVNNAYNVYMTSKDSADTLYAQEYQKWADQVSQATQLAGMQQTDYWSQTELDYKKEQDRIAQSNWEKEYSLSLAAANAKVDDTTGKVVVDNTKTTKAPTESQMKKALEAYNKDMESGDANLTNYNQYVDSLNGVDGDALDNYIASYGYLPFEERTYTKTKNTLNGFLGIRNFGDNGVDPDDEVTDQYGNVYKIKDLNVSDAVKKQLTNLKKGSSYTKK